MKSVNFRRKEAILRSVEFTESKLGRRRINWDRLVYLLLLSIGLFFGARYLILRFLYIEGDGQVLFDSVDIRNATDCRIIKFFKMEGDPIKKGQALFTFIPANERGEFSGSDGNFNISRQRQSTADVSWAEREIFNVQQELNFINLQINSKKILQKQYKDELTRIQNAVALDAMPSYRLDDQLKLIEQLQVQMDELNAKRGVLGANLGQLQGMIRQLGGTSTTNASGNGYGEGGGDGKAERTFYSPLEGTITTVMKKEFEVALKSESILSIHKPKNVYIKAFFEQSDLRWLKEGQIVNLSFPDGTVSKGVIRRFYFSTYRLPEEFQKKYEPTTRSLSADVYPVNQKDLIKWKTYWKLGVKITKYKYS